MDELEAETLAALAKVPAGTVNFQSSSLGVCYGEPLLYCMDGLLRYAKAYAQRFDCKLSEDGVLGAPWLDAAKGIRALLNGDGAVAMELGRNTDSKDNGVVEAVFWAAIQAAGFSEEDV